MRSQYNAVPYIRSHLTTANCMFCVILALLPSAGYGIYLYGLHAALIIAICIGTAVAVEGVCDLIFKRGATVLDFSAVVTGLIGGLILPANVPIYFPAILAAVAIISKQVFGGIGKNWLNPAGLGKFVLFLIFMSTMRDFSGGEYGAVGALGLLRDGEEVLLTDMLVGHTASFIGTGSAVTVLIGAAFLFAVGVTEIYVSLFYLLGFTVFYILFGAHGLSPFYLAQQVAGGSLLFTAFFMAEDYTTSPMSRKGKIIYGILLGILTGILRRFFGMLEYGSLIALLIGNLSVRYIDLNTLPETFGVKATVRKVRRTRDRRRREKPVERDLAGDFRDFEKNVVPNGATKGSETAGTFNQDSVEALQNKRAVTYDTVVISPEEVQRRLAQGNIPNGMHMSQSMPIYGQPSHQIPPMPKMPTMGDTSVQNNHDNDQ